MVKKGVGDYQIRKAEKSLRKILDALKTDEWVRYSEIVKEAELSTATVSKFLKSLNANKEIEKRIDIESGVYPYPVYYKITDEGKDSRKKENLKKDIETIPLIPLIMNELTMRRKDKFSDGRNMSEDKTTPLSPIFVLKGKSKIFKKFRNFFYKQIFNMMKKRYPDYIKRPLKGMRGLLSEKEKQRKFQEVCWWIANRFLDVLAINYYLSLFSFLKVKTPAIAEYERGLKANLLSLFMDPLKKDFLTTKYVKFFEHFLEILQYIMKEQNYSIEDLLVEEDKSKFMMILEVDFNTLSWHMKRWEELFFHPEKHWKRLAEEEPELFGPDAKPLRFQIIKNNRSEKPETET